MTNHTIQVDYEDLTFDVNFDYYPACKGARENGSGVQMEPDEPETFDLCTVSMLHPEDKKIKPVDVTDCLHNTMEDFFNNAISDHIYFESEEPDYDEDKERL